MKCISVKQPWANKIANGEKTIETRTWATRYRGPLAIASSKKPDIYPAGCVVAIGELVDCRPMTKEDEKAACCEVYEGAWAWVLKDVVKMPPRRVKGGLGIYEIDWDSVLFYSDNSVKRVNPVKNSERKNMTPQTTKTKTTKTKKAKTKKDQKAPRPRPLHEILHDLKIKAKMEKLAEAAVDHMKKTVAAKIAKKLMDSLADEVVVLKNTKPTAGLLDEEEAGDYKCSICEKTAADGLEFHSIDTCMKCAEGKVGENIKKARRQELKGELKGLQKRLKDAEKKEEFEKASKLSQEIEKLKNTIRDLDDATPKLPGLGPPVGGEEAKKTDKKK